MLRRALSLCAVLAFASAAHAGAVITLTPTVPGPYLPNTPISVDVSLAQSPAGTDTYLRGVQFDFNASDATLEAGFTDWDWNFSGQFVCSLLPTLCGSGHEKFDLLTDADGSIVSLIYSSGTPDTNTQIKLPSSGALLIGQLDLTTPAALGTYELNAADLTNPATQYPNTGAYVDFDFGNRQSWNSDNQMLGDGLLDIVVVPEPATLVLLGLGGVAAAIRRRRAA